MTNSMETALEDYEIEAFNGQLQANVQQFLNRVLKDINPLFDPDLPEVAQIDYSDPFCCILFLQKIKNIFLKYVVDHQSTGPHLLTESQMLLAMEGNSWNDE